MELPAVTPRSELRNALKIRQGRSEGENAVFECKGSGSTADVSSSQHTDAQFTPRDVRVRRAAAQAARQVKPIPEAGGIESEEMPGATEAAGGSASASRSSAGGSSASSASGDEDEDVEELQRELELERQRARALERRASEAENIAVWLKEELDRSSKSAENARKKQEPGTVPQLHQLEETVPKEPGTVPQMHQLEQTVPKEHGIESTVDATRETRRAVREDSEDARKLSALREELQKLQSHATSKHEEVAHISEQNLKLREVLNHEKQRVIELKKAENVHKQEMEKVSGDLELNQRLQDEVKLLREEAGRLREKIKNANKSEQELKEEASSLRKGEPRPSECNPEEMERLSMTVGGHLVSVERELAAKTKEVSDLADPFLRQAHGLLEAARSACQRLDCSPAGPRDAPGVFDPRSRDLRATLRSILELLHYMVEVLGARSGRLQDEREDRRSIGSDSSRPSMTPSRTIPESHAGSVSRLGTDTHSPPRRKGKGDSQRLLATTSQKPEEDRSWGLGKRWTCYLQE